MNRDELCHVPLYDLQSFLGEKAARSGMDGESGVGKADGKDIRQEDILRHVDQGGYQRSLAGQGAPRNPTAYGRGEEEAPRSEKRTAIQERLTGRTREMLRPKRRD